MDGLNLDNMSPEQLHAIFEQEEKGGDIDAGAAKDDAAAEKPQGQADPVVQEKTETQAAKPNPAETEAEPDGIASRDGKHIIPFSALQAERQAKAAAQQRAAELEERIKELEEQGKSGASVKSGAAPADQADTLSDEEREFLKTEFPAQYKVIQALENKVNALEGKVNPVVEKSQTQEQIEKMTVQQQVDDALDQTPKLRHIMSTDPQLAIMAKQFDNGLRASTEWQGKPLAERFAKVVEMIELSNGAIKIPGQVEKPSRTPEQLKKEAEQVAAQSAKQSKTSVPTSLSEFSGGEHAAADEFEAIENMSITQLASLSPKQMEAYLNKFS